MEEGREEEGEGTAAVVDLVTGWRTDGDDGIDAFSQSEIRKIRLLEYSVIQDLV